MGRRPKTTLSDKYTVSKPNLEKVSEYISKFIGKGRSASEYANVCGCTPATISNIKNGRQNKITPELAMALWKNRDLDCDVTEEEFFQACGLTLKDSAETMSEYEKATDDYICRPNNRDNEKLSYLVRIIIQDLLLSKKFSIEKVFNGYMAEDCFRRKILFEILIASNALESYGYKWAIKVMSNFDDYNVIEHFLEKLFAKICAQKNDAEKIKFSVVIFNEKIFNYVKKECQNIYLPSYVSLILINEVSQTIRDEYILNFKNSDEHVDSVLVQEEYSQLDFEIKEGDAIS